MNGEILVGASGTLPTGLKFALSEVAETRVGISTYQEETLKSEELDQEGKVESIEERGAHFFLNRDA